MPYSKFKTVLDIVANCVPSPNGCYIWTGTLNDRGYGTVAYSYHPQRNRIGAHRLVKQLELGRSLRHDEFVMHKCDTPACCRPSHLVVGTAQDNMDDMHAKGRAKPPHGETHPHARMTFAIADKIREAHRNGMKQVEIVRSFGVASCTVNEIVHNRRWVT